MKAHHPAAFMAANLSALMDDTDKVHQLIEDSVHNGLKILPPDVNTSDYRFVPVGETAIRYGLGAIKGTGGPTAKELFPEKFGNAGKELFEGRGKRRQRAEDLFH